MQNFVTLSKTAYYLKLKNLKMYKLNYIGMVLNADKYLFFNLHAVY